MGNPCGLWSRREVPGSRPRIPRIRTLIVKTIVPTPKRPTRIAAAEDSDGSFHLYLC
jgi:hypothetical protein